MERNYYMGQGTLYKVENNVCYIHRCSFRCLKGNETWTEVQGEYGKWTIEAWLACGYKQVSEEEVFLRLLNR